MSNPTPDFDAPFETEFEDNPDVNADLIGREYVGPAGYTYRVEGSVPWGPQYVNIESINHPIEILPIRTCVNAKLLRESLR